MTSEPTSHHAPLAIRYGEHLFISGDTNHINAQHRGEIVFTDELRGEWTRILLEREQRFNALGAPFWFILAPDKQTVYRHLLPREYLFRPAAFLTQLPFVLDVAPVLSAIAKHVDVYPKTDSHWNQLGAFLAVEALQARRGLNMSDIVVQWLEASKLGDLGHKISPPETSVFLHGRLKTNSALIYDNCVPNNGRIRIWSKPAAEQAPRPNRLALFGDSFSYDLVHFLRELFDVVIHVHGFAVDYRVVEAFQPNIAISEITERFMLRLPNPPDGTPLIRLWEDKIRTKTPLEPSHGLTAPNPALFPAKVLDMVDYVEALFAPFRERMS